MILLKQTWRMIEAASGGFKDTAVSMVELLFYKHTFLCYNSLNSILT